MRGNISYILMLLFFSTTVTLVPGCDETLDFANNPPGGLSISRDKCYLGPNDTVVLTGQATDSDGDEISYSWTAGEGTLTPADGKGQVVSWRAPDSHGTYRVTLHVTDGLDSAAKGIDLDVGRNLDILHEGGILDQTDYPYIVPNALPLYISELISITIQEGVTIVFNQGTGGLNVSGTLIINGTEQNRVLFTPNVCPGDDRVFGGIEFNGDMASGTMSYVTITSAADGLAVKDGASLTADNLILDRASGAGLSVESAASATISDARIWDNGSGVYVANGTLHMSNATVRYNVNYGFSMIRTAGVFDVDITDCEIANNTQNGFVLAGDASPVVHNCSIFLNGPTMEDLRTVRFINTYYGMTPVDMTGNFWGVTEAFEIQAQIIREGANGTVDFSGWLTEEPSGN
jgi:hypothetical protein